MSTDQVTNAILSAGFQDLSYQISQPILNDNSTKSYEVKEIKEDSGNPTDALVPGSGTTASFSYVYPKSGALAVWKDAIIYLFLKFTCTTSSEKATINICSDIRRIFGKVTTKINNTIESIIQDYGMTNYMVDILTKTRDVLMNSGIQGLYPDLAEDDGSMEDLRHAFIAGTSVTKAFMIPLGIPIFIAYPKYTIHRTTRKLSADDTFNFVKYKSIPAYVLIAFQPIGVLSNITAGTAHPDPCKFVDPGLLRISIEDGDKNTIPNEVHDLNIANGDFPFVYHDLMKCTKFFNDVVHGGIITRENFQTMYPIFAFKVRKNCAGLPELNNHECAINIHTILKPAAEGAPEQPQHVIWMLAAFDGVTTFNGSTGSATEEFGKD
ncbi:hypothetical protein PAPYR_9522 [Paratrimastix pyriformis]|uniref:Uncharacterized protein n=1 Tax=Paratrimastix pyriformis TaxID=342808 RepID=A0ABQ8U883_9EUKA|nr:hypothetical protein PAPYR_9522 [Paratrimastix pyriformis]